MPTMPMPMPMPMPSGAPPEMPEVDPQQMKVVQEAAEKFIEGLKGLGVAAMDMSVVFADGEEAEGPVDQENDETLEE